MAEDPGTFELGGEYASAQRAEERHRDETDGSLLRFLDGLVGILRAAG